MKRLNAVPFAIAIWLVGPIGAFAQDGVSPVRHHYRHHVHHHRYATTHPEVTAGVPAAASVAKPVAPPAVQIDSDGLSRNGDDCNMGCLDNTQ